MLPKSVVRSRRGVWRAPYTSGGNPVAIAVDSQGQRIGEIVLLPELDPADVRTLLLELLDKADPIVHLALVRGTTPDDDRIRAMQDRIWRLLQETDDVKKSGTSG